MQPHLRVMSTLAVEVAFERAILPAWRAAGNEIEVLWEPTTVLTRRIEAGERADVLVMIDRPIWDFARRGILDAGTVRPLARAGFGLAVRSGQPHPDITTPDRFREALLSARAVAYSRSGASGRHFVALIERLGIADAVNGRAVIIPAGFTGERLVRGEADLAVQQISELMSVEGVEVVGPFPGDLQVHTDFSAAVFADAAEADLAARFVDHLTTPASGRAYEEGGLASRLPSRRQEEAR